MTIRIALGIIGVATFLPCMWLAAIAWWALARPSTRIHPDETVMGVLPYAIGLTVWGACGLIVLVGALS